MNRYGLQLDSIDEMLDRTTALADAEAAAIEHNSDGGVYEDMMEEVEENDANSGAEDEGGTDDGTNEQEPDGTILYEGNGPAMDPNDYPLEPRMALLDRMIDSGTGFEVVDGNQESTAPEETPTHPEND